MLNKDRVLNSLVFVLFAIGAACILYVVYTNWQRSKYKGIGELSCVQETYNLNTVDKHMGELLQPNQILKIFKNYYDCNPVKREDLVYFKFADGIDPVIRIVKGIPGDLYSLEQDASDKTKWVIRLNGATRDINGTPYFITSETIPPLYTYQLSKKGVLGPDEYILLSEIPPGLSDSSNLGLISQKNLVGRALVVEK